MPQKSKSRTAQQSRGMVGGGASGKPDLCQRAAGVLLHFTSLPGPYGVGDLGPSAFEFLEWAAEMGFRYWQFLPLCPPGKGHSPYDALATLAGNPLLISLDLLQREKLLSKAPPAIVGTVDKVDFQAASAFKMRYLRKAFDRLQACPSHPWHQALEEFEQQNQAWLQDYCLFAALSDHFGTRKWTSWPLPMRERDQESLLAFRERHASSLAFHRFCQYAFFVQLAGLRRRAHQLGVALVGDLPILVAHASVEVWQHRDLFKLDEDGKPLVVAGVPPDYFSSDGQLWGNPLYRWDAIAGDDFSWWANRLALLFEMVDVVRIDHFRGFAALWEVPADAETAVHGQWVPVPGRDLFQALKKRLGSLPIIAEDLGIITRDVEQLRDDCGFPGMHIMQFVFFDETPYVPAKIKPHSVVYSGTHDNDTALGWYRELDPIVRGRFLNVAPGGGQKPFRDLVDLALNSPAHTVILPMQDLLGLDSDARMNVPGQPEGNWRWRLDPNYRRHPELNDLKQRLAQSRR